MELEKILIVEDEADIRHIIRIALEKVGGFSIQLCSSGHEALERLKTYRPHLLILDVMMPIMDGPSLLRQIQDTDKLRDIPVIFMTAKVQPQEVDKYMAMGVLGVISKPFDPLKLPDQLRELWQLCEPV